MGEEEDTPPDAEVEEEAPVTDPEPEPETQPAVEEGPYLLLVERPADDGTVHYIKFRNFDAAMNHPTVPSSSRVWISRVAFIQNAVLSNYQTFLDQLPTPVEGSDESWPAVRKGALFDLLLVNAMTPEQAVATLGVTREGKMARSAALKKEKVEKAPRAPRTPKTDSEGRAYSRIDQSQKIKILAEGNPKREGSAAYDRFKLYKNGMTVKTFLEKGGKTIDLQYDVNHKYIELTGAGE